MSEQRENPTVVTFEYAEQELVAMVEECSARGTFFRIESQGQKPVMLVPGAYVDQLHQDIQAAL